MAGASPISKRGAMSKKGMKNSSGAGVEEPRQVDDGGVSDVSDLEPDGEDSGSEESEETDDMGLDMASDVSQDDFSMDEESSDEDDEDMAIDAHAQELDERFGCSSDRAYWIKYNNNAIQFDLDDEMVVEKICSGGGWGEVEGRWDLYVLPPPVEVLKQARDACQRSGGAVGTVDQTMPFRVWKTRASTGGRGEVRFSSGLSLERLEQGSA
jgi:hypothetical protein